MPSKSTPQRFEWGMALPQRTGANAGDGNGYATGAYSGTGLYTGATIPQSSGRILTFIIGATSLAGVTRLGFHVQGSNNDPSGSMTWTNVAPHPLVQSGRFPSISPTILGFAASSTTRTPPDGAALTAEQIAIEARRLTRFAADLHMAFSVDLLRTGYKHHRLVVNEVAGAQSPIFAMFFKSHLEGENSSHPFDVANPIRRPSGFTDAQWAQYLDEGVIPTAATAAGDQNVVNELSVFRTPTRPAGLSDSQWDRLRNSIVDVGLLLQHRPDGV